LRRGRGPPGAVEPGPEVQGTEPALHIGGGVALLLWGVRMVRTGTTRAFGADLRRLVVERSAGPLRAFVVGLAVTLLLQSGTATALIGASFAGRGLLPDASGIALLLGADVGSAALPLVLSRALDWLAPVLLMAGVGLFLLARTARPRHLGRIAIGLGLVLLALRLVVQGSAPLRDGPALAMLAGLLDQLPLVALLVAALATWLAHSSLALVLALMAVAGQVELPAGLVVVLVLGINLGAGLPAFFATLGAPEAARRPVLANLGLRGLLAVALLPLAPHIAGLLEGLVGDNGRRVVDAHLAFNLVLALLALPLALPLAGLLARLFPDRAAPVEERRPRHLDPAALDTPAEALACAAREALRMCDHVEAMLARVIEVFATDDARLAHDVEAEDDVLDALHEAIKIYLTAVNRQDLDPDEAGRHYEIVSFTTNLEHIGDIIDKNLMELAAKKIRHRLRFSDEGFVEIRRFHAMVANNFKLAVHVFVARDGGLARELLGRKIAARDAERLATERHLARLGAGLASSIETSSLHLDIVRDLKRINSHLTAVAYPILERRGELAPSRLAPAAPARGP
jgi:phosphate:Na+ symporter